MFDTIVGKNKRLRAVRALRVVSETNNPAGRAKHIKPYEIFAFIKKHVIIARIRGVAQPGRVLGLGPRCRRFEPSHPDQKIQIGKRPIFIFCLRVQKVDILR